MPVLDACCRTELFDICFPWVSFYLRERIAEAQLVWTFFWLELVSISDERERVLWWSDLLFRRL
jgi:hypothetical protein